MNETRFERMLNEAKKHDEYWVAKAVREYTDDLYELMEKHQVSKAELARRIDSKPSYITKVLRGDTNFTLKSMVKLARALDVDLSISVVDKARHQNWSSIPDLRQYREVCVDKNYKELQSTLLSDETEQENEQFPIAA